MKKPSFRDKTNFLFIIKVEVALIYFFESNLNDPETPREKKP